MRTKVLIVAFGILMVPAAQVAATGAQSLADVARKSETERKTLKQPSKVLTNDDLGTVPPISPPPATLFEPAEDLADPGDSAEKGDDASGAAPDLQAEEGGTAQVDADDAPKDQAYWSGRTKELQTQISRNEGFAVALQSRINALANEYTNQADPLQQAALATDRQSALAELDRVTRQIEDDKKALAALQEEARRAGVPAGWLR